MLKKSHSLTRALIVTMIAWTGTASWAQQGDDTMENSGAPPTGDVTDTPTDTPKADPSTTTEPSTSPTAGSGAAQEPAKGQAALPQETEQFLQKVHVINEAEVKVGELAKDKAQSQQAKQFGESLMQDHKTSQDKLESMGETHKIEFAAKGEAEDLKKKLDDTHKALQEASGAEFDRKFAQEMVKAHDEAISMTEKAQGQIQNEEVKTFAQEFLDMLKKHKETATSLEQSTGTAE